MAYEGWAKEAIYQIKFHNKREYLDFFCEGDGKRAREGGTDMGGAGYCAGTSSQEKNAAKGVLTRQTFWQINLEGFLRSLLGRIWQSVFGIRRPKKSWVSGKGAKNIRGAFRVNAADLDIEKIILVDDIYTTGSTVDEMTEEFLKKGCEAGLFSDHLHWQGRLLKSGTFHRKVSVLY